MKNSKVKIVAGILLSVVMLFTALTPAFAAADKKCNCGHTPVLSVSGINSTPLYKENGTTAFPPSEDAIVKAVLKIMPYLKEYLIKHDVNRLMNGFIPAVNELFAPIACGPDGKPADPTVAIHGFNTDTLDDFRFENNRGSFNDALAEAVGEDHVFQYTYDWRRSPFDIADDINKVIQMIKAETGHDKVAIDGQSMGGCMVQAYLAVYGTKDVETVGMVSAAFTGVEMVSQLFEGNIEISGKLMVQLIKQAVRGNTDYNSILDCIPVIELVMKEINPIVEKGGERFMKEFAIPTFGYNPGMWTFVSNESFDKAYEYILADADESFKAEVKRYHELVQLPMEQRCKELAADENINYFCVSHYNRVMIPVTPAGNWEGDSVIETVHTSGYATVAKRGETLGDGYTQAVNCHEQHISPDNVVDASTCYTPENTWFIKNADHVGVTRGISPLFIWLMTAKEKYDIRSNPLYPQFMYYNRELDYLTAYLHEYGDVNMDGEINLVDARMALRHNLEKEMLDKVNLQRADYTFDGQLSRAEAQSIVDTFANR